MRKHDAIDLMALRTKISYVEWNNFLTQCQNTHDISALTKTRYGLQAGMADLAKQKLNAPEMIEFFIRLERSIDNTIKNIIREKTPNPCDNPLLAKDVTAAKLEKKRRDDELELFLKKTGY